MNSQVLGLSAGCRDSAACLLQGGRVAAAAQEERFLRRGEASPLPLQALNYCLQAGGITALDLDAIVFHEKPFLKLARVLAEHLRSWPGSFGRFRAEMPGWLKSGLCLPMVAREETGFAGPVFFVKRHLAQAAAAFFPSPFEEAAILVVDDGGEWAVAARGRGAGLKVRLSEELRRPVPRELGEEAVADMARELRRSTGLDSLCLAAACVTDEAAGRRVLERSGFKSIHIQPAAGDAAGALGAAAFVSHSLWGLPRAGPMDPYLGPDFTAARIRRALANAGLQGRELPEEELFRTAAALLAEGKSVGWFQGRMEFGPRSRGNRSVLRKPDAESPQTFDEAAAGPNLRLLGLLRAFRGLTGLPRLSGADLGAPLACTPEDAIDAFRSARLDALVLGDLVVLK